MFFKGAFLHQPLHTQMHVGMLSRQLAAAQHEAVGDIDLQHLQIERAIHRATMEEAACRAAACKQQLAAMVQVGGTHLMIITHF